MSFLPLTLVTRHLEVNPDSRAGAYMGRNTERQGSLEATLRDQLPPNANVFPLMPLVRFLLIATKSKFEQSLV